MIQLTIVDTPLENLSPSPRSSRRHSKKHVRQIANSISKFGFLNPVLCDANGQIIVGHGRVEGAKLLGLPTIPVICAVGLSPEQLRAYAIAENRISEQGEWDTALLSQELAELQIEVPGLDFTDLGFEIAELDFLLGDNAAEGKTNAGPPERLLPPVTQRGDVWGIGEHRLGCLDATHRPDFELLMQGELAQMVFTDPPYNVRINGHVSGKGNNAHPEFAMASGEMNPDEFIRLLHTATSHLIDFSVPGSIHYICMDHHHVAELLAGTSGYAERKNICVWAKTNAGMGSLYRSQHEFIFVFKSGKAPHINNIKLGKHGRNRTNVWRYGGMNSFGATRDEDLKRHPTVKPVELVADAIKDCSKRKGLVLDAFVGSGTTLVAAEQTGRRGRGLELDPWYVDAAVQRLAKIVGEEPRLASCGTSFEQRRLQRTEEALHG